MRSINILQNQLLIFLAIFLAFFVFAQPIQAATAMDNALSGLNTTAQEGFGEGGYTKDVPSAIGKFIGGALAFVGVLFFVLIIYGGFVWMTARGNEQEITKAKDIIIAAVIGLVLILAAYAITSYIGGIIPTAM